MSGEPLLVVDRLAAGYGRIRVLNGVSLTVPEGGFVTIVGANGAGKTTLLKTLMGLVHAVEGSVTFKGHPLLHKAAHQRVELGIAYVPEGRHVFPSLTVHENLELTAVRRSGGGAGDAIERIYELFPRLRERRTQRAKTLSGGEQQMLALGRALVLDPIMLIADEISLGWRRSSSSACSRSSLRCTHKAKLSCSPSRTRGLRLRRLRTRMCSRLAASRSRARRAISVATRASSRLTYKVSDRAVSASRRVI